MVDQIFLARNLLSTQHLESGSSGIDIFTICQVVTESARDVEARSSKQRSISWRTGLADHGGRHQDDRMQIS